MFSSRWHYRKFMILSSPRCGTHMVRRGLDVHPYIVCRGEMFNPDYATRDYDFAGNTPVQEILRRHIFTRQHWKVRAVGFCLHRTGALVGDWPDLWEILAARRDLHIISIRRRNLLRRYVSFEKRPLTDKEWQPDPAPLLLNKNDLVADFEHHTAKNEEFDRLFRDHPMLAIDYEDLCADFQGRMRRVQNFLRVRCRTLHPVTPRLITQRLDQVIQNYEELKFEFAATPWAGFFDA